MKSVWEEQQPVLGVLIDGAEWSFLSIFSRSAYPDNAISDKALYPK